MWKDEALRELSAVVYELSCDIFKTPQELKSRLQIIMETVGMSERLEDTDTDDATLWFHRPSTEVKISASLAEQIILGIHALALLEAARLLAETGSKDKESWLKQLLETGRQRAESSSPDELKGLLEEILKAA
jgi:hypothetical protein